MSLGHKEALEQVFPIFNEMKAEGFDVEFYYVTGFGGFTLVPSTKRIRVKANKALFQNHKYAPSLANKVRVLFESRNTLPVIMEGKKLSVSFRVKKRTMKEMLNA